MSIRAAVQRASTPDDWRAFLAYPSMRQEFSVIGAVLDLYGALREGRLKASGRRAMAGSVTGVVPMEDWARLIPDYGGPCWRSVTGEQERPWRDIMVLRADVERLWRRTSEIEGRSRYPKPWFRDRFAQLQRQMPKASRNELIVELAAVFEEETGRTPPSRSTIQRYIKRP